MRRRRGEPGSALAISAVPDSPRVAATRTFCAGWTTKGQEPQKGRTGGNAMFWKFIDAVAAIAMAIAVLN
jgi:hypothetical protein